MTLTTPRLILRLWRDDDLPHFAAINTDPRVMRYLPGVLDRATSDARAARIRQHFDQHGFGLFAVEIPQIAPFIGFVGLSVPNFTAPFTPCVEIGWRLAFDHWGRGYATEAAQGVVAHAFGPLGLRELVSFTVPGNVASRRVMEKLGMTRDPAEDFHHPALPAEHPLSQHVLYRLTRKTQLQS
ncbi:MAG: GNAT family N-acetyltransferase [Pirellulales bacterium]|nr:GNAT family N-acetyltransferase [Pirellulales bacterium]